MNYFLVNPDTNFTQQINPTEVFKIAQKTQGIGETIEEDTNFFEDCLIAFCETSSDALELAIDWQKDIIPTRWHSLETKHKGQPQRVCLLKN